MKKRIGKFLESMRDNIFVFILYTLIVSFVFFVGFRIIAVAPPVVKFLGLAIVISSVYLELYFPTFINKFKTNQDEESI